MLLKQRKIGEKNSFIYVYVKLFFQNQLTAAAAEMAYFMIFAFFPLLMIIHASFSMAIAEFDIENTFFHSLLPNVLEELVDAYIDGISENSNLSFLLLGIVLTVITLTKFTKSFKRTIRRIYGAKQPKNPIADFGSSVVFSVLIIAAFYVSLILLILGGQITAFIKSYFGVLEIVGIEVFSRFFFTSAVIFAVVLLLYRFIPGVAQTAADFIPGTLISSFGWVIVSGIFSFYMDNFANYSLIYGSIGAFIMLLLWIYMSCLILLAGATFNALVYRRRRCAE